MGHTLHWLAGIMQIIRNDLDAPESLLAKAVRDPDNPWHKALTSVNKWSFDQKQLDRVLADDPSVRALQTNLAQGLRQLKLNRLRRMHTVVCMTHQLQEQLHHLLNTLHILLLICPEVLRRVKSLIYQRKNNPQAMIIASFATGCWAWLVDFWLWTLSLIGVTHCCAKRDA